MQGLKVGTTIWGVQGACPTLWVPPRHEGWAGGVPTSSASLCAFRAASSAARCSLLCTRDDSWMRWKSCRPMMRAGVGFSEGTLREEGAQQSSQCCWGSFAPLPAHPQTLLLC